MAHWIENPYKDRMFADQIMGDSYIPFGSPGGRHIMDDFGSLIQALPQSKHDYEIRGLDWRIMWNCDIQYMYH